MDTIPDAAVLIEEAILDERKHTSQFEKAVADKIAGARAIGWTSVTIDTAGIQKEVAQKIMTHLVENKGFFCNPGATGFTVSWDPRTVLAVEQAIAKKAATDQSGTITVRCASLAEAKTILRYYTMKGHAAHILEGSADILISWPASGRKE